ncbi:lipocalin family protein [Flagellimonas sp. 389]|uniref:lipocalin family protein n=1 Tax=Flagellimonas sp. 389 TaxID=2835862 RepID=UPI0035303769
MIGRWRFISESLNGEILELSECETQQSIEFKNNSAFTSISRPIISNPPQLPPCELEQLNGLFQQDEMEITFFLESDTDFSTPIRTVTILTLSESTLIYQSTRRMTIADDENTISIITWERIN